MEEEATSPKNPILGSSLRPVPCSLCSCPSAQGTLALAHGPYKGFAAAVMANWWEGEVQTEASRICEEGLLDKEAGDT